ncbi:SRPBCC family protein [Nonomuraea phyllanthi]|uniref:polyketide cyclase n=1 Tax=Nonomuraea phyllanthi TaxID=2219224 RepID=UPI001D15CDCA|nr:polyketide cyclase [Nonomuraea phyllanthi]
MDSVDEIDRAHRELVDGERKVLTLRRRYDAEVEDVWGACTDAERLSRWFLPVTGGLKLGGSYQLEGSAGGETLFELVHAAEVPPDFLVRLRPGRRRRGMGSRVAGPGPASVDGRRADRRRRLPPDRGGQALPHGRRPGVGRTYEAAGGSADQVAATVAATTTFYATQEEQS